ncbi:MAG: penicillin acylase family protein [Deltaproteobacteria bacterium HGW-Deltaproteobacteria-12]|nr:MAG: penicillin acylase family protein [Deltaproteobacteria bacterium HGW-Deltaproteobacteria-12]
MSEKKSYAKAVKITLLSIIVVFVLLVVGGYLYYLSLLRSPLPRVDGELRVNGLQDKVEVIRDSWGVPHIYARNMHDLFFAQGYTQAQDRWWQMEFFRHTCAGRIEELTGRKDSLLNTDIYLRSLGLYKICRREYDQFTPEQRAPLDAFVKGVNAYLSGKTPRQLSINYSILGLTGVKFKIEPWSPLDSLAFAKLMALDLGLSRDPEIARTKLHSLLGPEMTEKFLVPSWPHGFKPTIMLPEDVQAFMRSVAIKARKSGEENNRLASLAITTESAPDLSPILGETEGAGSNGWVATGPMTQSGKAILANDPHLGIQMPSIWYEIALHSNAPAEAPFNVAGFTFAASPGIVVGHNSDISWGTTNVYPDVNDQYMLKINPANSLQYQWNGSWRDMTVREETINFGNGKPSVVIKVRETHLGPVINENRFDPKTGKMQGFNNTDPLSLHWTALEPSNMNLSIIALNKARNWDEFRNALKYWDVPSQSVLYADRQGNIGFQMPGKIPIRPKGYTGQTPAPGWTDEYVWKGYVPFDLLPRIYNPARNFIVASNQEAAPPQYYDYLKSRTGADTNPNFGSRYNKWNYGYRAQRIYEMIQQLTPNTVATYRTIQLDNKYLSALEVLPYLTSLKFSDREVTEARDWLLKWDGMCNEDNPYAALYGEFWMKLTRNVFQNKLGSIIKSDAGDREMWAINLLLQTPDDKWWDDPATAGKIEKRDDVLVRSFAEGYAATVAALGKDRSQWKWGTLHAANFISNPLGVSGIGPIESIVNKSKVPMGGSSETVNSQMWMASSGDFSPRSIPSMRMIIDMNDLTKCESMNSSGPSGNPGSPGYGNMIEAWRTGKYRPMLWTRQQVEAAAAHKLVLMP